MLRLLAIFSLTGLIFTIMTNLNFKTQEYTDIKVSSHGEREYYFMQVHPEEQLQESNLGERELPIIRAHYTYSYKNSNSW